MPKIYLPVKLFIEVYSYIVDRIAFYPPKGYCSILMGQDKLTPSST
jgi:hypothetical protein